MTTRQTCICLLWVGLCWQLPAHGVPAPPAHAATTDDAVQVAQAGRYGPYATLRRANEVATWFRQRGYQAVAFHDNDGYYVNVR